MIATGAAVGRLQRLQSIACLSVLRSLLRSRLRRRYSLRRQYSDRKRIAAGGLGPRLSFLQTWVVIELLFLAGTDGPNRFGPDPAPRPIRRSMDVRSRQAFLTFSFAPQPLQTGA